MGYVHIDVTDLPQIDGIKKDLFVAIDRYSRSLFLKIYEAKTVHNASTFFEECVAFFPFKIKIVLTDNGVEFTNKCLKNKNKTLCQKVFQFTQTLTKNAQNIV